MALREVLAKFGFELDSSKLKEGNALVDGTISKLTNLKGVLSGALAGLGLGELNNQVKELAEQSEQLKNASLKAGVGFEQFQKLSYVTETSAESLTVLFRRLQQSIAGASGKADEAGAAFGDLDGGLGKLAGGGQHSAEIFKKLGVTLTDAHGKKDNAKVFTETALALSKVADPAQRTALAMQLFGRSGQEIIPFLSRGPEEIQKLSDEFDTFGGITKENEEELRKYTLANKGLDLALRSVKIAVLSEIVPAFVWLFQKINEGIAWFKKHVDTSQLLISAFGVLTAAVVAFGGAAIVAWAKALAGPILVGAAVLLLIAIVDDLIHFFKGDAKTATEDLIHLIFGKEAGDSWIATVRKDVHALVEDLTGAKSILEEIGDIAEFIASGGTHQKGNEDSHNIDVAVVNRGLKRKTRERTNRAFGEAGEGYGEREDLYGPSLKDLGVPSLYGKRGKVEVGPLTTGPLAPGGKAGNTTIDAKQNVTINQTINGADSKDAADQSVEGVKVVLKNARQAQLNATEARK